MTTAEMTSQGFAARRQTKRVGSFLDAVRRLARRRGLDKGPLETHHVPDFEELDPNLVSFKR